MIRLRADFNGLFGSILCLSHSDHCEDDAGKLVEFREGMIVTAFDEDSDENGNRDDLLATGTVERSPDWLQCNGSRWALIINHNGVRHASETTNEV